MKLVVLGATGGTGMEIVRQAIEHGHSVTAFVRSADRLKPFRDRIIVKQGDLGPEHGSHNGTGPHPATRKMEATPFQVEHIVIMCTGQRFGRTKIELRFTFPKL